MQLGGSRQVCGNDRAIAVSFECVLVALGGRMRLDLKQLGGHGLGSTEVGLPGVNAAVAVALVFLSFLFL